MTGKKLKFSFIIPTLNEERLLPAILKQICNEELKSKYDYEVIVSDGGSNDNTVEIALQFADKVTVHDSENLQNIAEGRNRGAKLAAGENLIFINADVLLQNVDSFFNYINIHFINSEFLAMTTFVKIFPAEEVFIDKFFHFFFNHYFYILNFVGIGMGRGECQVIRASVFQKLNGYREDIAAGEDFNMFVRIRKLGTVLYAKDIFVFESPRRFRKLGYLTITGTWIKNGFSVLIRNKAISKIWEQVR